MNHKPVLFLMLLFAVGFAQAKSKHPSLPEASETAKTVHVEARDARDITDISVDPDTRNAILDVQDAIEAWGRYTLSRSRHEADLILVVYKGHLTHDPNNTGTLGSIHTPTSRSPIQNQNPADASQSSANDNNSADGFAQEKDELKVYTLDPNNKLKGPIWTSEQIRGLETPNVLLFQRLKQEVEKAYPATPATKPSVP